MFPPGLSGGHQEAFHSCPRLVAMAVSVETTPTWPLQLCPQDGCGGRDGQVRGEGAGAAPKPGWSPRGSSGHRQNSDVAQDPGSSRPTGKQDPSSSPWWGQHPPPATSLREGVAAHINPKGLFQEPTLSTLSHSASTPRDGNRKHFWLHYFFQDLHLY